MDNSDRLFVFSTLECVRAAIADVDEQAVIVTDDAAKPTIADALGALRVLEVEVERATSELMHRALEQARV